MGNPEKREIKRFVLKAQVIILLFLVVADFIMTSKGIALGLIELNPVVGMLTNAGLATGNAWALWNVARLCALIVIAVVTNEIIAKDNLTEFQISYIMLEMLIIWLSVPIGWNLCVLYGYFLI